MGTVCYSRPAYGLLGCSRTGAIHLRQGQAGQDALHVWQENNRHASSWVLAVADGHGHPECEYAGAGAKFAVQAAVTVMQNIIRSAGTADDLLQKIPGRVGKKWRRLVREHAIGQGRLPPKAGPSRRQAVLKTYGSTLLAAMLFRNHLYLAQLGDGMILALGKNGEWEMPARARENLLGTETYSLSQPPGEVPWNLAVLPLGQIKFLILATDGLADAFEPETEFRRWARDLRRIILEYGLEKVAQALPNWLDDISRRSIGDDITMAAALFHGHDAPSVS